LYNKEWKVIETSHNIWFDPKDKVNDPDMYMMCTPHHLETFSERDGLKPVVEYPIIDKTPSTLERAKSRGKLGFSIDKTHILNVGLWTAGKNQSEGVDIARIVEAQFPGKYQFHFVGNQAENFEQYWKPIMDKLPDNVTVWGERTDVDVFMSACDAFMFNSTWECSPLALREAIGYGLITFSRDLPQYKDMFTPYIVPFSNDLHENVDQLIRTLKSSKAQGKNIPTDDLERFTTQLKEAYGMVLNTKRGPQKPPTLKPAKWTLTYQDGPKLTIDQAGTEPLRAEFWDGADLIYAPKDLQSNSWYKPARNWWTQWHVKLYNGDRLVHTEAVSLEGKELTVEMASSSLGDTLAFMGQLHAVMYTHKPSRVYVKTHKPWLFDKQWYLDRGIEIIDWSVPNKGAVITIGVFYTMEEPWKRAEHKYDWRTITLGKIAADRLGVEYVEQRPQLAPEFLIKSRNKNAKPSIVIATHSTAQAKYWNNPTGWQETIDWCNKEGVKVYHASKEGTELTGVQQLPEELALVAAAINDATMFIGISSGLSWFAWALGAKVVIISGFTDPYVEFESATYVNNHHVCHGCWGWDTFDKGDWNWCPSWKGTQRQFECTKTIGSDRVIEVITKQVYG
jgi:autotransporter strand-loop-strand O-heptosyltransferase